LKERYENIIKTTTRGNKALIEAKEKIKELIKEINI